MVKIYSLEEIKNELTEYGFKNNDLKIKPALREKINFQCFNGHIIKTDLQNLRIRKKCVECERLKPFEEAKTILKKDNFITLTKEKEYVNTKTKIQYICSKGHFHSTDVGHLRRGKRCKECKKIKLREDRKRRPEQVIEMIKKENYIFIDWLEEYINEKSKILLSCDNEHIYESTISNFAQGYRCQKCWFIKNSGENNRNWRGGISEISEYLRNVILPWKKDSLKKYKYKCFLTNRTSDIHIHHHYNFSNILKETMNELKLEIKQKVNEYEKQNLENIEKLILEKHYEKGLGIVLHEDIHKFFHKIYGNKNNNMQQVLEFKKDFESGKYPELEYLKNK